MSVAPASGLVRRVAPSGDLEIVLTAASVGARSDLGATAWSVFEVLALGARSVDGDLVAESSIRAVATRLRIGKDRAAAAFAVLREAGWIELRQARVASNARFASASYVVHGVEVAEVMGRAEQVEAVKASRSESWTVSSCETASRLFGDEDEDDVRGEWQ
jgi:hypothetical protein